MPQTASLSANARNTTGKGVARSLRRAGRVPAVIYGRGREPEALDLDATALERLLAKVSALTTLVDVTVADRTSVKALIREIQRNPIRPSDILHVDLYEVHADEAISVEVPIAFTGVAEGVRNGGGVFEALRHELEILVLPGDIPDKIEVDITALIVGQSLHVSDIGIEKGEILTDAGVTLCTVVAPKVEEAPAEPTLEAAATTEPELIRKPKPADEEEAE
jgi:large subunit ribosomal protein L25